MRINLNPPSIFSIKTEKLGELVVFPMNIGSLCDLSDEIGHDFSRVTPLEFCKKFILRISYPKDLVIDDKRPKEFMFEQKAENDLSEDDVEHFAEIYITYESKHDQEKNGFGQHELEQEIKSDVASSDVVKNQDEKYYDFLYRIKTTEYNKFHESLLKTCLPKTVSLSKTLAQASSLGQTMTCFSAATKSMIESSFSIGESLKSTLRSIEQAHKFREIPIPDKPRIDFADISRQQREFHERPFKPIYEKLEQLNLINSETVKYISLLNETQTSVALELKQSSDQTTRTSQQNYKLSLAILALSIISLIFTVASTYFTMTGSSDIDRIATKNTAAIETKFSELINNETRLNNQLKELTIIMSKQHQTLPSNQLNSTQK